MRYFKVIGGRLVMALLAAVLACGNMPAHVAWGIEASQDVVAYDGESGQAVDGTDEAADGESDAKGDTAEIKGSKNKQSLTSALSGKATEQSSQPAPAVPLAADESSEPATVAAEELPYSISVTFGGRELSDKDGENNFTDSDYWTSSQDSKFVSVVLKRNGSVPVDADKKYVLSLSVPNTLFFSGIPTAESITGVSAVGFKKNATFKVNKANYGQDNYSISQYSGEIRLELNTTVDQVEIADLGVSFDPVLLGYKTDGSTLSNAFSAKVVAVDKDADLSTYNASADASELVSRTVDSLVIKNVYSVNDNLSYYTSNNSFVTAVSGAVVNASSDASVSYGLRTGSMTSMVYGSVTLTFEQPYILVDGVRRYLDFDEDEEVLTTNRRPSQSGWRTASKATYDEATHTFTFYLENVLASSWSPLVYSPTFTLPSDLADSIPDSGYAVKTSGFKVIGQKTYLGDETTQFPATLNIGDCRFVQAGVNIKLCSSNSPFYNSTSRRNIYKKVNSASGLTASIGLFDIHNEGVSDSQEVNVEFKFNTGGTGAIYKVDRLNIPFYGMGNSAEVAYTVSNGTDTETGTTTLTRSEWAETNGDKLYVYASTLSGKSGYYIESLSYTTKLRNSTMFHTSVTHGGRNYVTDAGVFTGQLDGEVGQTAEATMTIASKDGTPITSDGQSSVTATEKSAVSDDNSVSFGTYQTYLGGRTSALITAGDTSTLSFTLNVTSEEYPTPGISPNSVNGYHIVENPVVYICLPDGVSIAGTEQAYAEMAGKKISSTSVSAIKGSECTVDGQQAKWWAVEYDGANVSSSFVPRIQLSTEFTMAGVTWDFSNKVVTRSKGQKVTWALASTYNPVYYNSASSMQNSGYASIKALGSALSDDAGANGSLGAVLYRTDAAAMLNVARAEAKLDVDTELSTGSEVSQNLKVADPNADVDYEVTVRSTDGGYADAFEYYVPVPKQGATIDANSFVSQGDYGLQLKKAVEITDLSGSNATVPFEVYYTTKGGLDSSSVRALGFNDTDASQGWQDEDEGFSDFANATAVLIMTKTSSQVASGSEYRFNLTLGYDASSGDFASQAGRVVKWRSFGHYTYTRNGSETTNTYPSQDNSVKLGYVADFRLPPINVTLDTGADENIGRFSYDFNQSFLNDQSVVIKNVTVSDGTSLVTSDPTSLAGSDANSKFRMALSLNGQDSSVLENDRKGGTYGISANTDVKLTGVVRFSRALTDTATPRYVDVLLGNDDIDITVRIWLSRIAKAASATRSGTVEGEQFQAASVSAGAKTIAANGAFTALYVVDGFVPGNFSAQKLVWKYGGVATALPAGATVTMLVLDGSNSVSSRWVWRSTGASSIDLSQFTRMGGSDNFSYDKASTKAATLKYQFVVSFPAGATATGDYTLGLEATPVSGATAVSVELPVTLASTSGFSLSADGGNVTYNYTDSAGDDVRTTGKQLALVLTPAAGTTLPADAAIKVGNNVYARNASGYYIVPLGTVESGSKELSLVSSMVGAKGGSYAFDTKLMLYSGADVSPMAGSQVGSTFVTLGIAASASPSIKVTGTRVAHKSEWSGGVDFSFAVQGVPDGGSVTVSAYNGLKLTTPATNLMSSVGGVFDVNGGTGTYKGGTSNGKLVLNSAVDAGTYRLVFEVKDADGTALTTATHYVIVRN